MKIFVTTRESFLAKRKKQMKEARAVPGVIVMEVPEDLVICDVCNAEVKDNVLKIIESYLHCSECINNLALKGEMK